MPVTVDRAASPEDVEAVRVLVREFFRWAMAEAAGTDGPDNPSVFAGLEAELAGLPGRFGPPSGCLILARLDGEPAGCVAYYGQSPTTMEIKRMFVRPEAWGHGIGARMLEALLAEARAAGYERHVLSTHPSLHRAQAVYRRAGFREVPCSADFPGVVERLDLCMQMIPAAADREESRLA